MFIRLQNKHDNFAQIKKYKVYCNTLNCSLRLAKQNHCHCISNENKSNSKKAWEDINELSFDKKKDQRGIN